MRNLEEQRNRLIDYFRSGEKSLDNLKIGIELEHFIIDSQTLKTVSYYGENGVEESLKDIEKQGWEGYYNDEYLLGLERGPYTISTEPAAQFEISMEAQHSIKELDELYLEFMKQILPVFKSKNQELIAMGYHPVTKIDEIKISPKKRYTYMYEYFKKRGTHAHNMMKGTCAVQVTIDFTSEEDFIKKYRIGSALSPILYTMYDNSYIFESEVHENYSVRQHIWENTDLDRSGVLKTAFDKDFSYGKYADYILNNNIIFTDDKGELASTGDALFKDIFDPEKHGDEEIYHAISIVFPDLRLKRYLEFRMMDAVPYPLNFSAAALIKGLMYSDENLERLDELFKDISYEDVQTGKSNASKYGMNGIYLGRSFVDWANQLIYMAKDSLDESEAKYLDKIQELSGVGKNPRDDFRDIYNVNGLKAAVEMEKIEVENV